MILKGLGQIFAYADSFRRSIWNYTITRQFEYRFERNCLQCIVAICDVKDCEFYICVRGVKNRDGMIVKDFRGKHTYSVGEECKMRQ